MKRVDIKIKRLEHGKDLDLPRYMTEHAAGMDLSAAVLEDVTLKPGERRLIPTGLSIALPAGYEAQIRPRSGLALKQGISLLNTPGTIDADYRGEIGIIMVNHAKEDFVIKRGERIAQMVINEFVSAQFDEVEELPASDRHEGGFGHTGR